MGTPNDQAPMTIEKARMTNAQCHNPQFLQSVRSEFRASSSALAVPIFLAPRPPRTYRDFCHGAGYSPGHGTMPFGLKGRHVTAQGNALVDGGSP
jgi:hypothetical protein